MKKQEQTKRPSIFVENRELGILALKAGFGTVGELAAAVERNHRTVTQVLRGETKLPVAEKLIAEKLGITVNRLRTLTTPSPQPEAKAA